MGAHLDAVAMDAFASQSTETMGKEQLVQLFKAAHSRQVAKLELLAYLERSNPTTDRARLLTMELARGEAYTLLAERGGGAQLDYVAEGALRDKGYDTDFIVQMLGELESLRDGDRVRMSLSKMTGLIEETGASATAANIARSSPIYLKAIAEALLSAADRYGSSPKAAIDFAGLLEVTTPTAPVSTSTDVQRAASSVTIVSDPREAPDSNVEEPAPDGSVRSVGARLISKKTSAKANAALKAESGKENEARAKTKGWDDKAVRQAEGIFDLFDRFLVQEFKLNDLSQLRQHHLAAFEEFLRSLNSNFGKSPTDKTLTIAELRSKAEMEAPAFGSLATGTLNRHLTYVGQLIRHAGSVGVMIHPKLSTNELKSEQHDRGRNQRPVPAKANVETLFNGPVFTGCAAWDDLETPGEQIWHGALYYGTLLALYQGLRREEFCGLAVDEVVDGAAVPYLIIQNNAMRRIKNLSSRRVLAIHPELIRLGFLDYVIAMRALGYHRLFHDLYSPTTKSPLGDRFYDQLLVALRNAGITPHQLRHFFSNALKQKNVSKEFRADLLGHMGETETDERYVDPVELQLQLQLLAHLPVVTSHLERAPLRLLPWVEAHQVAPFSRLGRGKR